MARVTDTFCPTGGEGQDEGATAQYFTAQNLKNGKEMVKF